MVIKDGKMRKNIVVLVFLGFVVTTIAWADYSIGTFVALKGADGRDGTNGTNGTDCRPTETRTRCYGTGSDKCADSTRSGVKIVTTQCDGSGSTTSYIYDNNCGITVASTTDVHQDNDSNKPVTHKRVAFKNTCTNETLSTTADVPVGCTPTYTQKYINKETNGSFTYDNASRTEKTIGARVTVSGCGNDNSFDTYDGNDGTSFNYKGSVENCDALYNISNPAQNDAYIVNGDGQGKLCIYNGSSWPTTCPDDCAEFTGPAGDNNCTGYEDSNAAVKHTLRTYSGPSGSTESDGVTVYATRGKMVLTHRMCNTTLNDTVDNENDPCVPIIAPSGVTCNGTYFECKPQGTYDGNTNYAKYNLCEATTGTTFSSALNGKEDTACVGSDSDSALVERKKTVEYTAPSGSGSAQNGTYTWKTTVGKLVNKSVKCSGTASTIGSTPDSCVEIARPNANVCSGTGKVYYQCTQQNNGSTYNLCTSGTSVLDKIDTAQSTANNAASAAAQAQTTANGKIDASYLSANGYLTSDSNLNAGKLTGTIDSGRLPSTVVTVGDDATHGLNTLLSSALSTGTLKDVVTSGTLNGYVKTTGMDNNSISTILSDNNVVTTTNVGSCQAGTTTGKNTPVTCSDNSLAGQLLDALLPAINAAAGGNTVVRQQ